MAVIDTDKYISIVKGGNMDDMFDYGVEIGSLTPQVEMGGEYSRGWKNGIAMIKGIVDDRLYILNGVTAKDNVRERRELEYIISKCVEYKTNPTNKGDKK